jgi:hypothetical protein
MIADTFSASRRASPWSLRGKRVWAGLFAAFLAACSPQRLLLPGERIVWREPTLAGHILPEKPPLYVRANSRLLGLPLSLWLYGAGETLLRDSVARPFYRIPKVRRYYYLLGRTLHDKLGETPALLSESALRQDVEQLEALYAEWGYFQAAIQPRVRLRNQYKAFVTYGIQPGPRWNLEKFSIEGGDSLMLQIADSLFLPHGPRVGQPFSLKSIDSFREKLHQTLLENGYYDLPLSLLILEIDTTAQAVQQRSRSGLLQRLWLGTGALKRPPCQVRLLLPDNYHPYALSQVEVTLHTPDQEATIERSLAGLTFRTEPRAAIILDERVLLRRIFTLPGERYNYKAIQISQRFIQLLPAVQWVLPSIFPDSGQRLRLRYEVLLRPPLEASLSVEGFQSTQVLTALPPLPGASMRFSLSHLSLLRRGWTTTLKAQGFVSYFRRTADLPPEPLYSFLGEFALTFPQGTQRLSRAMPRPLPQTLVQRSTALRFSYQDLRQPVFSRRFLTVEVQRERRLLLSDRRAETHLFTPLSLIFVQSTFSPAFEADILSLSPLVRSLILRDFLPRLTQISAYQIESTRNYFGTSSRGWGDYSRLYVEVGGVGPALLDIGLRLFRARSDTSFRDGSLWGKYQFGLFGRVLLEGRLRYGITQSLQWVGRVRMGVGQGFFYTRSLPFENRFFLGGPSSMRGWQFGSLGPGRYPLPPNRLLIPGGEILTELGTELRWTFYQGLQIAPFLDAGNVWFWKASLFEDPRGILSAQTLRPAIAGGIGLRWDFSFLVIRLDVGQQVYDPATNRWIGPNLPIGGFAAQYHIAIGYPF